MNDQNVEALGRRAVELAEHVGKLRLAVDSLARRTDRSEKILAVTVAVLVLVVVLSGAVMWTMHVQQVQQDQLADNQAQARAIRDGALCPLFALILGSYQPGSRPSPQAQQTYDDAYAQMRTIYQNLACTTPIVPPRTAQ